MLHIIIIILLYSIQYISYHILLCRVTFNIQQVDSTSFGVRAVKNRYTRVRA